MLALILLALNASLASATVSSSRITAPAGPTFAFNDTSLANAPETIILEGTYTGPSSEGLAINCYAADGSHLTLADDVVGSNGSFSATISTTALLGGSPCVIRAVSEEDFNSYPPGSEAAYQGPVLAVSELFEATLEGDTFNYNLLDATLDARHEFQSVGSCGLTGSTLILPPTLAESQRSFLCVGGLYGEEPVEGAEPARSEVQIDGVNAYDPYAAEQLLGPEPGIPTTEVADELDPATGLVTINETDPMVFCAPLPDVFPPTASSCSSFRSTGVSLERTWKTEDDGRSVSLEDVWLSTDGTSHSLDLLYDERLQSASSDSAGFRFPGASGFVDPSAGTPVSLGAEPGTVIYQEDRSAPTTGDGEHPFAAITFPSPPNGPATFTHSDAVENETGFVMPYRLSVAPGAAATVQMNFSEAYSLEEIERASGEAVAAYTPTLVVASPIAGAVLTSSEVTAAGDVSGEGGSSTLTVNGIPVEVRPDDTWSKVVSLRPGANTLVVVATGADGVTKTDEVAVSYVPPNDEEPVENGPVGKEPTQAGRGEEDPFEVRLTEPGLVEDLPAAGLDGKAPTSGKPAHERADAHRGNHKARSRAKSHRRKKTRRRTSERLRKKRKRR